MKDGLHNKEQFFGVFFSARAENRNNTFGQKQRSPWSLILEKNKKQGK